MANLDYAPFPETDTGGNITYIQYDNNQSAITNLNYVEWSNILSNPLQTNDTNDIIYRGNRIGIGMYENQIPVSKIHLIGDLFITENEDTWDFLRFYHTGNIAYQDFGGCEDGVSFRMNTGTTSFQDNPSLTEIMRFRNNKIGILKNNPQYSLDVNGSLNSTSLYVNDVSLNTIVNTLINDRNYLTISTASLTYATITNLSTKENALTFSLPLTRNADNISIDLSAYATNTNLNLKQNVLSNSTVLLGTGGSITGLNYNNISNAPINQWTTNGTNIYYNTGYLGIGTTTPQARITIRNAYGDGANGGLCLDARDTVNNYNLKLYSFVQAGGQVAYNFEVNNIASSVKALTFGYNGNIGIGGVSSPSTTLSVKGAVNIHNGGEYTGANNYMKAGSLTIGDINENYGNGGNNWSTNTAGLLLQCITNTEIMVHDSGTRLTSLIQYNGDSVNTLVYGRGMSWGYPTGHYFNAENVFNVYLNGASASWNNFYIRPTSLWGDGITSASETAGTKFITMGWMMFQNPHIVPATVGGDALIRIGRAGGISTGTWWEIATKQNGNFNIGKEASTTTGICINPNGNIGIGTNTANYKLDVLGNLNASNIYGSFYGNGSNISNLNYNNIGNRPDLSIYATTSQLANKQDVLSNGTLLLGNGSNISNLNYSNIPNRPDLTNKQDIYTVERKYPSRLYDSITPETTTSFLGKTVYTTTITLNSNSSTYDFGIYNLYYSSIYSSSSLNVYNLVNNDNTDRGVFAGNYIPPNGFYTGSNYIVNDYLGDWIIIKLTKLIILTKIIFYCNTGLAFRSPGLWKIYGSNDGINWDYLPDASNTTTRITTTDYSNNSGSYTKTINNNGKTYLYYGLVVNQISGNDYYLDFAEWAIYGVEKINCMADWNTTIINKPDLTLKQDLLSNGTLLLGNGSNISNLNYNNIGNRPDLSIYDTIALRNTALSSYLTTSTASSTYATITNLNNKENALTFSAPLTRTTNTISLDLSAYDTIALRNTALSSYLTTSTASSTYATITNLNTKENALTFSAPLTRTTNTISLDLSAYDTIALRNTALSSYLTTSTASSTYATITNLNTKENALTFSAPLTRTTNTISLDLSAYDTIALRNTALSSYITTANANALNSRFFNNNGNNHGNYTDFNSPTQFGYNYIQGTGNSPNVNGAGQYYSWDIGLGANYPFGTYRAQFALPRNVGNPYLCVRYQENGGYGGWNRISAGYADSANVANSLSGGDKTISGSLTCGVITALIYAINNTGTDYLGVSYNFPDTTTGVYRPIWAMLGSFTGFHRCFTNDELFDNTTDETIKDFKFKYAGRVVISSGNIATDDSNNDDNDDNKSWTIHYDKEGITLEDALPIVQLSRQRKDKRVFGVFGLPKRNNSRIERMIINSVGEGGIWVVNTNGNIENGDYLQTSNELGYAEKQDDDLLHNYTVGKATIDCNFELNSNKYETIILENGVKASFIACSYHCG